jgi:DNA-binding transcriptional MerR regulator
MPHHDTAAYAVVRAAPAQLALTQDGIDLDPHAAAGSSLVFVSSPRSYQVSEVARLAGVSVRALHHYDAIGLLSPSGRTEAGYRLYGDADLARLQQILIGRELGLPLEAIRRSLDDPGFDRRAALTQQRAQLLARSQRTAAMVRAIDAALATLPPPGDAAMTSPTPPNPAALFDGLGPDPHADEARARWGHTDAYQESARRTRGYSKDDWARFRAEAHAIHTDAAALFTAGVAADSAAAMDVAERHRRSIDQWFYPCPHAMHANLADLYQADPRFAATFDKYAPGLTPWWSAAIRANPQRG